MRSPNGWGAIREAHGPKAIGLFSGTPPNFNGVLMQLMPDWMKALGSPFKYSTATIDQSSHWVTASRMGYWDAGKHRFEDSEVILLLGCNPLVSMAAYYVLTSNPAKRLKAARAGRSQADRDRSAQERNRPPCRLLPPAHPRAGRGPAGRND
ncbi:hypothetical protein ACFSTD_01180 [Novosphingobium colocasiae]